MSLFKEWVLEFVFLDDIRNLTNLISKFVHLILFAIITLCFDPSKYWLNIK